MGRRERRLESDDGDRELEEESRRAAERLGLDADEVLQEARWLLKRYHSRDRLYRGPGHLEAPDGRRR